MLAALTLAAALAFPARAQDRPPAGPAVAPAAALPDAPAPAAGDAQRRARDAAALRRAVFLPRPALAVPSFQDFQRERERDAFLPVGHRVVSDEPSDQPAAAEDPASKETDGPAPAARGWTLHSVQLAFARPLPGVVAGVGVSDRHEWLGRWRSPNDHTTFAFVRIQLGKPAGARAPRLFLPEARVIDTTHAGTERTTVDDYSIHDLPPGLIP